MTFSAFYRSSLIFTIWGFSISEGIVPDIRNEFPSPERVKEMATLSALVYSINSTEAVSSIIPDDQYKVLKWIDEGSTEVLITQKRDENNKELTVTFRGSEEIQDWIVNANFLKVPFGSPLYSIPIDNMYMPQPDNIANDPKVEPILVHRGFNDVFLVYKEILDYLKTEQEKEENSSFVSTLYVAGHSLGGANAFLFASMYAFYHPTISVYCSTFGQPRAGNFGMKMFVENIRNLNYWRFVNNDDVVPRIPLAEQGFTHAGHLVWNNKNTQEIHAYYRQIGNEHKNLDGIPDLSSAVFANVTVSPDLINDHSMVFYGKDWLEDPAKIPSAFKTKI